jgi:hypothetical protein
MGSTWATCRSSAGGHGPVSVRRSGRAWGRVATCLGVAWFEWNSSQSAWEGRLRCAIGMGQLNHGWTLACVHAIGDPGVRGRSGRTGVEHGVTSRSTRPALFNWVSPVNTFPIFQCFSILNQMLQVQKYKT